MKEKKSISERLKDRLEKWKGELEELQVQLSLGGKEAQDRFEEQKKHFREWIDHNRDRLDDVEEEIGEEAHELRAKLDDLKDYLNKERAESVEAFQEQKHKLTETMQGLRAQISKAEKQGSEKAKHLMEDWDDDISKFRMRMDMLALQVHLGMKEAGEEMDELRDEAREKLAEWKEKIADSSHDAGELWNDLRSDLGGALKRFGESLRGKGKDDTAGTA